MPFPQAYAQYNNSRVLTASKAELTLMLYDGAIKFGNIALMAINQNDIQKANTNLKKVGNIIDYLRQTLDMKYPVAKDFENIYSYLSRRIVEANIKKDPKIVEEVLTHLRSVRDTWKEVMKRTGQ